jgi:hypothetical protein
MTDRIIHSSGVFIPTSGGEDRYESYIASLSQHLFPDYIWCDFKAEVRHPDGLVHADAALVASDYSRWYVVEVELTRHRWDEHIRPQLIKLSNGIFSEKHRRLLLAKQPRLSEAGMGTLDIYTPDVALIIEMASAEIRAWCRLQHILCIEASPYTSRSNDLLLAINGDVPASISEARIRRVISRASMSSESRDIPMLVYEFPSEISEREDVFRILIGNVTFNARNFGSQRRGLRLMCSYQEFYSAIGDIQSVELLKVGSDVYRMEPRSIENTGKGMSSAH